MKLSIRIDVILITLYLLFKIMKRTGLGNSSYELVQMDEIDVILGDIGWSYWTSSTCTIVFNNNKAIKLRGTIWAVKRSAISTCNVVKLKRFVFGISTLRVEVTIFRRAKKLYRHLQFQLVKAMIKRWSLMVVKD